MTIDFLVTRGKSDQVLLRLRCVDARLMQHLPTAVTLHSITVTPSHLTLTTQLVHSALLCACRVNPLATPPSPHFVP